jgi:hypothetical protein
LIPLFFDDSKESEDEVFFPLINVRSFYVYDATSNILKWIVYDDLSYKQRGADGTAAPAGDVSELRTQVQSRGV